MGLVWARGAAASKLGRAAWPGAAADFLLWSLGWSQAFLRLTPTVARRTVGFI